MKDRMMLRSLVIVIGLTASAAGAAGDDRRDDWYFRESLNAIRDWETILTRWERTTPADRRTPILPLPCDGAPAEWPNPIPARLWPAADRGLRVEARLVGSGVEVARTDASGRVTRTPVQPAAAVVGTRHPGGGGKDQWYHRYDRRFDQLTSFIPTKAPFALGLDPATDLGRGAGAVVVALRNASGAAIEVKLGMVLHTPAALQPCARESLTLTPGERRSVRLPIDLKTPGGGLIVVTAETGGQTFWLPVFTHVEDVGAIVAGVETLAEEARDPAAVALAADLRRQVDAWRPGQSWSSLFESASAVRDRLLQGRVEGLALLFVKRKPFDSEQPFMDAHHLRNRPGGGIYRLRAGKVTPVVDSLGEGVYRDICLHRDARRFLFAFGNGSDTWDGSQSYHIYEANLDGSGVHQLTTGPKNDCEPFYLPDDSIGFTSDRSEHFVMCGGDRHAPNLFTMQPDGSAIRRLSHNTFNEFTPTVLDDGRILYSRWEYNERSVTSLHHLFTMRTDGSMVAPFYGNATIRPNVVMFARPVPGSHKVMALFTAHHGQTHGTVGLIDVRKGVDGPDPLELLTPGVPLLGEHSDDSRGGWFSDPVPLSDQTWLCSYTPTVVPWHESTWALYVADRHGNLALLHRDPNISCAEPVPIVTRARPRQFPELSTAGAAEATLVLGDVYVGLTGVPRGTVRWLRVLEDLPRDGVRHGGVITTSGTQIYTVKRILGTVPVEPDGSAHFVVPADRNVYFEALDADQCEVQRMRSVVCLKSGETRSCIGCHERPQTTPPRDLDRSVRQALMRPPSRPAPPPWGTRTLSFLRDVQPVLNDRCVSCHAYDRTLSKLILTDDLTDQFTVGYEELLPYLSVASAMRWDNPDDVLARPPYTYGSKVSPLCELLARGHHGVALTEDERLRLVNWVDANGVYYDRYETSYYTDRHIFNGTLKQAVTQVFDKRCATCHGRGDGRLDTWVWSLNRRDVGKSRALAAPLARQAGGWGLCDTTVFASQSDPDYQALRSAFESLAGRLQMQPREDLVSIRDTPAASQQVSLPPLPPARPVVADSTAVGWVSASDLPWESATAGWTHNGDNIPRRDQDVEDHPLRLGTRRYRKGIGTHAPSEVVYRLDGQYTRLRADMGGAEAGGTVVFEVYADGRRLFRSGLLHGRRETATADLPLEGVHKLTLVVTDGGDGYGSDMANWADLRFKKTGGK